MSTLYYDTLPPSETLPNSPTIVAPNPAYYKEPTPEERAEHERIFNEYLTRQIQRHSGTRTCNCGQSSSSCNCPTTTPILSPTSTPTNNKKYMYIAGGLIIALFIFSKK